MVQGQDLVRVDRMGDVVVLVLAQPPVNALSAGLRLALMQALQTALADPQIIAVVLRGTGKGFSAGADIAEFGKSNPDQSPAIGLGALCQMIENAAKPVIAALHGMALGGGLELALSAHYRVAEASASLGLPEVNLGLLPGAGGTQRLPRLIGAAETLRLMLTGAPIRGAEALALGLVDRVVDGDRTETTRTETTPTETTPTEKTLTDAALAMAHQGLIPRRSCDMRRGFKDMTAYLAAVATARATHQTNPLPAPLRIVDCVEAAALLPFPQGLVAERAAFTDLMATPQAAGLRHAFFTERRAAQPPANLAAKGNVPISRLGLWGVDDMAADLAFQALSAGLHVVWAAPDRAALVQALGRTATRQEQAVVAGLMSEDTRDADWARLTTGREPDALAGVDLALTAPGLPPVTLPGVTLLQAGLGAVAQSFTGQGDGPDAALTVPYDMGGLAELSCHPRSAPEVIAKLMTLARQLNWRLIFAGPGGPIELHLRQAMAAATDHLVAQGMDPGLVAAAQAAQGIGTIAETAAASGLPLRQAAEVLATCLAAMAAEGARMVQDGRARRPLDVDAVALLAGLVPRWMGGPMFQADQRGLLVLRQDMRHRAMTAPDGAPSVFAPVALFDDLIRQGQRFASLNDA